MSLGKFEVALDKTCQTVTLKNMEKKLKKLGKKIKKIKVTPKAGGLLAALFILGLVLALAGAVLVVALIAAPIVGIWWLWQHYHQQRRSQESYLNSTFYQLLQENFGRVSVLEFALKTNLKGSEARQYLDQRAREFAANFDVTEEGEVLYCFPILKTPSRA